MDFLNSKTNLKIKNNQQITHCLFDMDGLLLDTEPIFESIVGDIAKMFDKSYPHETRLRVLGTTEQMMAKIAVTELDLPISTKEFHRLFTNMCRQRFCNLSLMEGAERLLRHLHKHGVPIALATSSSLEMAEFKMTNHTELFDLFHHKVMGSTDPDVMHGKPAPDIFLVAGRRFPDQPKTENCLVFEDAPNGVRAASLAGMPSVLIPDDMVEHELRKEATVVLHSLLEFQPEKFGLPAFDDDMLVHLGNRNMPTGSNEKMRIENSKPITHCLFDMDGLLLDTEPIYESIVGDIANLFKRPYTHQCRLRVLGTTEQMMAQIAVEELDLPITPKEFHRLFTELCRQRFLNLSLMEGAERLLRHLHKHRVPIALATSSSLEMANIKMTNHRELFDMFHHKVMGSTDCDVKIGKPAPDIFLVAGNRFPDKPKRENCLVFEDAPNGVRAACLAGMPSIFVPDEVVAPELHKEATVVLRSLLDFKPEDFGLPPFNSKYSSSSSDSETSSDN